MQFGMILLVLVIACSLAGSLIVQQREPMEYVTRYGESRARLIMALQLDDVFYCFDGSALSEPDAVLDRPAPQNDAGRQSLACPGSKS